MKTIDEYKNQVIKQEEYIPIKTVLKETLENIKFLENIYMMGGDHYYDFSEMFRNSAFQERQDLCQLSSACFSILRERGETA